MQIDYLLVGQGLAGSVLADHLISAGYNIHVISDPSLSNSSQVAGGLYNPVTGRKLVKTWNCDNLFDYLVPYYRQLEQKVGSQLMYEKPIYRPFLSIEAQNEWMGSSADGSFDNYVTETFVSSSYGDYVKDDFGGVLLKNCGYVDTACLTQRTQDWLKEKNAISLEAFDYDRLTIEEGQVTYGPIKAKGVIFCEGQLSTANPWFGWLPFKPVKGELLYIKTDHEPEVIYNRGVFVLKKGDICKVGATYDNTNRNNEPTEKAKNELNKKLQDLIKFDYKIVDQKAGIRPATKDRRPFVGQHPSIKNAFIFNGLGAKGVSLAPFYANQLVQYLKGQGKLDAEVNIERYFSLF